MQRFVFSNDTHGKAGNKNALDILDMLWARDDLSGMSNRILVFICLGHHAASAHFGLLAAALYCICIILP